MLGAAIEEKKWTLVKAALALPRPLGIAGAIFGLIALSGYLSHIESFYRPIAEGPATHPLTALCIFLIGLGVSSNNMTRRGVWIGGICTTLTIWITTARLAEAVNGTDLTSWMTPFHATVAVELEMGRKNSMGVNTASMLLSIALALALQVMRLPRWSQSIAFLAVAIPVVSFTGYAYGLENFYGQMSLLTATAGFWLACATLALTADHAGLRAILSPYIAGKIARVQAVAGYLVPTALGYVLVKSFVVGSAQQQNLFGIFVVAICWFIILMISISAIFHEKADFGRRLGEAKLVAAALIDSLTGLPNRRMFFESAQRELERIKRTGGELWVLMVDIDCFKKINDTAGHAVGDQVLIAVATLLNQSVRNVDLVGRLGGEEFVVVITDSNWMGCERVAESLRKNVESLQVPAWTSIHGPVTISVGGAKLLATNTLEAALKAADMALYQAKNGGRNQVVIDQSSTDNQ